MTAADPYDSPSHDPASGAAGRASALALDEAGWVAGSRRVDSPNCDARPADCAIELIVIHNISLPPGEFGGDAIEALLRNRLDCSAHPFFSQLIGLRVSSHFLVRRDGALLQFVPCLARAWHAGVSQWNGRARCNDFSIGVELEGADDVPYVDAQYEVLAALVQCLRARYPIAAVVGHSDIAPGRKSDPGPAFDWHRLRHATNS